MTQESLLLNRHITPALGGIAQTAETRLDRFDRLVRRYEPVVHAVCRTLAFSESEASRICEDAFVKIYRQPEDLTADPARFLCETMGAALNLVNDVTGRRAVVAAPGIGRQWATLPSEARRILALRFAGRLEMAEVGKVLRLPMNAVRSRLWKAMRQITGRLLVGG